MCFFPSFRRLGLHFFHLERPWCSSRARNGSRPSGGGVDDRRTLAGSRPPEAPSRRRPQGSSFLLEGARARLGWPPLRRPPPAARIRQCNPDRHSGQKYHRWQRPQRPLLSIKLTRNVEAVVTSGLPFAPFTWCARG